MADRIVQTFGIDAQQALEALKQLDVGFAQLEARLNNVAKSMGGVGRTTKGMDDLGTAFRSNVPEAIRQTERLHTSLALLSRIVFTQAIVRGLSQIRRTLERTGEAAVQFQKHIALTTTIADGAGFGEIADQVHRLSNEFNLPLLETAKGLYNALSNQVGGFGDSVKFSEEAARFAKATNSSLADSVDLLSAALKGYGLGVEDTDKVSSIFFSTIDKGRINASELANSFGRVDTIAADLGVTLPEVGGALAAISVRGTKTSEALTQFRAILSALQKPSETMGKRLAELGFTSSEVAIKTLGLTGILDELSRSTGGSAEQMAKLFPNIRGLSGAASLTSDDLKTLSDNIREMTEAGRNFNREKFLQATATDAERVTTQLNILKNEMTVGLGQATLDVADHLFQLTGGANNLIQTGKQAVPLIAGLTAAMVGFRAATAAQNAEMALLSKSLGLLALVPAAIGLGTSIGSVVEDKRMELLFRDLNKLKDEDKKFLAEFESNQKIQRDAFNATNDARVKAALVGNRELNRLYLQDVENAKNAAEQKAAFEKFKGRSSVDENALGSLLGRKLTTPDQVSQGLVDASKKAATLRAELDRALAGEQGIERLRGNLAQLFTDLDRLGSQRSVAAKGLQEQFEPIIDELRRLRGDSNITEEELSKVIALRDKLGTGVFQGGIQGTGTFLDGFANINKLGFGSTLNSLDAALKTLQQIQQIQNGMGNAQQLQADLNALNSILQQAAPNVQAVGLTLQSQVVPSAESMKFAFQATDVASLNINSQLMLAQTTALNLAAAAAQTAASYEQAASAASKLGGGSQQQTAQFGKLFRANGGRGVDTIPAMLSAGEFVMNPKATNRFFSQIQAMNAGQQPVFRQDGGSVTNNQTIGDINIHGASSPEKTGRAVIAAIKREQRRGSSRL
jgi:TP901 family phage tail tape measure protein